MSRRLPESRLRIRHLALVATAALPGCMSVPEPPLALPSPPGPAIRPPELREEPPPLAPPLALAPQVRWIPAQPGEGTLVALVLEPRSSGLPVLEARARANGSDLKLAPLQGGGHLGLLAAPLRSTEIPVEVDVLLIDGTRLSHQVALPVNARSFPATRLRVAGRYTAPDPATLQRIRREREIVRAVLRTVTEAPLWRGAFISPLTGPTTSPYGQRRLFNNELRSRHTGLDIDGDTGDPIYAANSGRVALSRDLFYSGHAVYIDHGLGFYTGYFHMSERLVSEGQWVEKGELIGLVGATGRVTGSHLHWSLYVQGAPLDPLSLLEPDFGRLGERLLVDTSPAPLAP